jgi:hypothetical protein
VRHFLAHRRICHRDIFRQCHSTGFALVIAMAWSASSMRVRMGGGVIVELRIALRSRSHDATELGGTDVR